MIGYDNSFVFQGLEGEREQIVIEELKNSVSEIRKKMIGIFRYLEYFTVYNFVLVC